MNTSISSPTTDGSHPTLNPIPLFKCKRSNRQQANLDFFTQMVQGVSYLALDAAFYNACRIVEKALLLGEDDIKSIAFNAFGGFNAVAEMIQLFSMLGINPIDSRSNFDYGLLDRTKADIVNYLSDEAKAELKRRNIQL